MNNKVLSLNIGATLIISWIIFEYYMDSNYKKRIKEHLKNVIAMSSKGKFSDYYSMDINNINFEFNSLSLQEKNHTITSYKNTFENRSSSNLESYIKKLFLYDKMRDENNTKLIFQNDGLYCNYLMSFDKILWYPYILRVLFSIQNMLDISYFKNKYEVIFDKFKDNDCYRIFSKEKKFTKNIIIFIGLGGFLYPFKKIVDLFISFGYQVIIPIYGSCQASLNYNIECHEAEFQEEFYKYLKYNSIKNVEILCWSLGGILYKGFERNLDIIKRNYPFDHDDMIKIDSVYLIEPLIGTRGCSDTFFSQIRSYNNTLNLMHDVTNKKYHNYNYIFSYFLHTVVGFSTCASFGYYNTVELIRPENKIKYGYPRYLFVSSDDIVFNKDLDCSLIETNFYDENIYYRKGYHGGWLMSNKVIPVLKKILT